MTWIGYTRHGDAGYEVRTSEEGERVGWVRSVARLAWQATCDAHPDARFDGTTRPGAARKLAGHWRQVHAR